MKLAALLFTFFGATSVAAANITYSNKSSEFQYPVTVNGLNLLSASAAEIVDALSAGSVTTVQLVDAYISRIEANDYKGLNLHSIIEVAPTAREIAAQLDFERANGTLRSSLHGVPIVVKDNFNTDIELGMNSTAGSYTLLGTEAKRDAFVIDKLRDAGILILGKTNLQEFSGGMGRTNTSAWSARGGQVSAAYVVGGFDAGGDPSGSSSGSAVAVSAGFAAAALGTDTEASIINPSNRAALYGLRPSTGITSRTGVVPISSSQDTTGPMAKSVWDVAALFEIMAVHDEEDPYSASAQPYRYKNYRQFLGPSGFQGLRIGIPREPFWNQTYQGYSNVTNAGLEATFEKMRSLGATIIDPIVFPNAEDWKYTFVGQSKRANNGTIIVQYDLKNDMKKFLMTELTNTSNIKTLEDIINYNELHSDLEFPPGTCCQGTFVAADQLGSRENSADYWYAKSVQQQLNEEGIEHAFRVNKLDLLLVPTEGSAARLGAVGRCPVGTVPVGYDTINLPYGMSFVGQRYDEPTVFRAMSAYEANFPVRKVPPTLD